MPLYSSKAPIQNPRLDVVYRNLSYPEFGNEILDEHCTSIIKKTATFNVNLNLDTGTFDTIEILQRMISKELIIKIVPMKMVDKNNQPIAYIILENFKFIRFKNLLDYDWYDHSDIKNIRVKFDYDKATFINKKSYNTFIRKLKLQQVELNSE